MRFAVALGSAGLLAVAATASAHGTAHGVPHGFSPEAAAMVGTRDLWVLGEYHCSGTWCLALVRSTDAGKHFARVSLPSLPAQATVPTLEFANARNGFVYIDGTRRLYATHDGGSSWHRAGLAGKIVAFALGGGNAYAVVGHVLERSQVGRNAWRRRPVRAPRLPVSLAARASDVWFLGPPQHRPDFDTLMLSANRGRTFTARKGPCLSELGGTLVPAPDGVVWAVCPTGNMAQLALSRSDGRSFPSIESVHDHGGLRQPGLVNSARIAAASARVAVLSRGAEGALLRTTDAGRHWRSVPRTGRIKEVFWLGFTTSRVGAALVQLRRRAELWRTTDGGSTWQPMPIR